MACRLAAELITDEELDQLKTLIEDHSKHKDVSSGEGYFQQSGDFDFHFRIAQASQNEFLISTISGDLYDLLRVYRYKSSTVGGRAAAALEEHLAIIAALGSRDPDAAERAMRTHIQNSRVHTKLALEKQALEEEKDGNV